MSLKAMKFRKLEISDLDALQHLKSESFMTTHRSTFCNSDDQRRWFESLSQDVHTPKSLVMIAGGKIQDIASPQNFGVFKWDIDWQNRTANVGWDVFEQFRRKGLGKHLVIYGADYSFVFLGLRRITAEILVTNEASIKCAENAGFVKEGCKRKAVIKGMQEIDSLVYGKLNPALD